jgi:hypothetical protein
MISILDFDAAIEDIRSEFDIQEYVRAANDEHVTRRLKDRSGPVLVAALPTFQGRGDSTQPSGQHVTYLWILEKPGADDTEQDERDQYHRLQQLMNQIREYIQTKQEDGCSVWWRLQVESVMIDPEYNIWGGWNGWHMTFLF